LSSYHSSNHQKIKKKSQFYLFFEKHHLSLCRFLIKKIQHSMIVSSFETMVPPATANIENIFNIFLRFVAFGTGFERERERERQM
jgi:hypothetical protein